MFLQEIELALVNLFSFVVATVFESPLVLTGSSGDVVVRDATSSVLQSNR